MTQKEIFNKIQEALVKEELAIPIYTSHIQGTLFWSGLDEAKRAKIIESLEILAKESNGHVKMLQKLEELYS